MENNSAEIDVAICNAIQQAWNDGCPIAQQKSVIHKIAVRRWCSSSRRKIDQNDKSARIKDLAKGLIQQLESEPSLVGPLKRDYEFLASQIAEVIWNYRAGK